MSIVKQTTKRGIRILLRWRGKNYNFGSIDFKKDGSLVFSSAFHADTKKYPVITTGRWDDVKRIEQPEKTTPNISGIHLSLHPKKQVLHLRVNNGGPILESKSFPWFPVSKEFLLARAISPPLDECVPTKKEKDFIIVIPDDYDGSLEFWIRIFPWAESLVFRPQHDKDLLDWIIGFNRGNYWVACGVFKSNTRSSPAILYPV